MSPELTIPHPFEKEGSVLVEQAVLSLLRTFRQTSTTAPEAGGVLLGFRRGPHLHVTAATTPQPCDRQSRYSFARSEKLHQRLAHEHWHRFDHTGDYLGEWHTHPETKPAPSGIDISEWRRICVERPAHMLFLILGNSSSLWLGCGFGNDVKGRTIDLNC
ncbi:Mov34/MPN/PAD-1 family protein [Paraburkholderia pallida]|uniref:JAB domain-containing protein n=1 Tax=Paraburkholderia pallida TaxID=2547399 RepID=A0A4P7D6A4_9BURK|nr:Mov34/MPN/PAD-1 family protein [Paraburkholderia pallida]QBR02500.1 hypothetical protein E1956_35250 [Paraburkholderia pallida]